MQKLPTLKDQTQELQIFQQRMRVAVVVMFFLVLIIVTASRLSPNRSDSSLHHAFPGKPS